MADLVEVLIGTGIRKGEALALRWENIDLDKRVLYIHTPLSAIDNNRLVITTPKTRSSRNWVAISRRVADDLRPRRGERCPSTAEGLEGAFVFHRDDGQPLRPEYVLNHFHYRCRQAGVSRTTIHDLRHLSATITLNASVPLTVVSKTLHHSTLSTTANIYSHLTAQAAREAVDVIDKVLTRADRPPTAPRPITTPRPLRDHIPQLHNQMTIIRQPTRTRGYSTPAPRSPTPATALRPQADTNQKGRPRIMRERPPTCENRWSGRRDLNPRPLDPQSSRHPPKRGNRHQKTLLKVGHNGFRLAACAPCGPKLVPLDEPGAA
ncbi:site-specific integrase [Streptomyces luteoverticillatus]|nr:site-specific integrase [Streptomyces luteoverticillatus]